MRKLEVVEKPTQIVTEVRCNICGKSMICEIGNICGLEAKVTGCYDSTSLSDGVVYHFDICEECLTEKIFPMFIIPAEEEDHL